MNIKQFLIPIAFLFFISVPAFAMDGNVLWLKFDDNVADSSGLGQIAASQNEVYQDGVFGKCMYFDGNSGNLVIVNDIPSFDFGTGDFSVDFWIKDGNEEYDTSKIVAGRIGFGEGASNQGWYIESNIGTPQESEGQRVYINNFNPHWVDSVNGTVSVPQFVGRPINDSWFHVVMTKTICNGESCGGAGKYYYSLLVNSIRINTDTQDFSINVDSGDDLQIGGIGISEFKGCIDEFRVWNRALSEEEINNLMTYNSLEAPPLSPSGQFFANTTKPIVLLLVAIGLGLFVFHRMREGEMDTKTMVGIALTVLIGLAFIAAISGIA